jgi:sugar lactone lactonase YvrE
MDFLQAWGPYAPALFYLWIGIAYGLAYLRTRKTQEKNQISGLFLIAIFALLQLFSLFRGPEENPSTMWWVTYGLDLCWPLVLLGLFHGIGKRRNTAGYHHPIDVMLFRPPRWTHNDNPADSAHATRQPYFLATVFLVLFTAFLAGISYTGVGLQLCGWLDVTLERSGCLRSVAIDRATVESVAVSPDGSLFAAGGSEQTIRLYRIADGQLQRTLTGHTDWVTSVAFSPDRALLASGSWDGTVRLWRVSDGTVIHVLPMPTDPSHKTIVVTFSPDGTLLAAASRNINVQLWRVADGTMVRAIPSVGGDVAFSRDGTLLAVEQPENKITLWQLPQGRALRTLAGHKYNVTSLTFSPDGQTLVSASGSEQTMKVWRVSDGVLLQTIPGPARSNLTFSADGKFIASGGMTNNIQRLRGLVELWNVAEGKVASAWEAHRTLVNSVAFSPDGKLLVSGSSWETIRLWRVNP